MKLIILKTNLVEGLSSVEKAVGNNVNLPILKNILLKADQNKITLTTTNLELAINHYLSGKIIEQGQITVPFFLFNSIIKNLVTEKINLEQKENNLVIQTDNYEATLQGQNADDFPIIPQISDVNSVISVKTDDFKQALSNVIIATQYSEIRPEISGVFLNYQDDQLKLVATDSFRLAEKTLESNIYEASLQETKIIIPLVTAQEVLRVVKEDDMKIFIDANQIFFKTENLEINSRLIDGRFPDYQMIVPKEFKNEIIINRQEFINAVKLTSTFTNKTNDITIKVGDNEKSLEIIAADSLLGKNIYKIPVKLKGGKFSVVFNWRYLLDGLKVYNEKEIIFGVNNSDKPVILKSAHDKSFFYILMPIKG